MRADRFDAIVIGAGFSGLYALHRLRELGVAVLLQLLLLTSWALLFAWDARCFAHSRRHGGWWWRVSWWGSSTVPARSIRIRFTSWVAV